MYIEFNGVHIGHGPFLSSFDLSQRKMVKMIKYNCDLLKLFEKVENNPVDGFLMNFGVVLTNGDVYIDLRDTPLLPEIKIKEKTSPDHNIPGKLLWGHMERKQGWNYYVGTELDDGTIEVWNVYEG